LNKASKIVLGTVQLGLDYGINNQLGKPDLNNSFEILQTAYNSGISFLDTAEAYGDAVDIIGKFHAEKKVEFNIISKFGSIKSETDLNKNISETLTKLNQNSLYAYLFHSPSDIKKLQTLPKLVSQLNDLKSGGKIKKIGISIYTNDDFEQAIKNPLIELIQFPFNVFDNNNKRLEILKKAKDNGKEVHCRSVFLQGLFYKKPNEIPNKLPPLIPYLEVLNSISKKLNLTITELALNYALSNPYIDKVLIGVDSVNQLNQNISNINFNLTQSDFKLIDENINIKEEELLYPYNWN